MSPPTDGPERTRRGARQTTTVGRDGWERIWTVFEEAIERPRSEIPRFLDEACGDDLTLRRAVDDLLEADRDDGDAFFDQSPIQIVDAAAGTAPLPPAAPPTRVGPYTLRSKIGEGGMGAVYLAVRDDDAFRRRAVVKIIRPGMESDHVVRRLLAERQILASLEHPNIARLYDGGSTERGLPYVVMEYVDGVPIDEYCRSGELSIDERLALFRKVCAAVSYAHRNLVVHRDLKPSNILVTADGEPKLLDFGIAKLLNPDLAAAEVAPTITATRMLTPSYASPEQIRGRLVTTVSDIYSLGVLLYELLTGRLPYDFSRRSPAEIEKLLVETDPERPSLATRSSDAGAAGAVGARRLSGDLDAIVLKALRMAPPKRYSSVEAMSEDIARHLRGEPVAARRGGMRYRLGKFMARHRAGLAAAALLLGLLVWFGWSSARQAARLQVERDQARLERDSKQQVIGLFEDIVAFAEPYAAPGEDLSVRLALLESLPVLESRLEDQPGVRAQLLHTTGSMLDRLGAHPEAKEQLEEALALRREAYGAESEEVAETSIVLARVLKHLGDYDPALELVRSGIALFDRLDADEAGSSTRRSALSPSLGPSLGPSQSPSQSPTKSSAQRVAATNELVSILCYTEQFDAAERPARDAIRRAATLDGEDRVARMEALDQLALVLLKRGEYEESIARRRESLALRRELYGERHPSLMVPVSNLGVALRNAGELEAAEAAYRESLGLVAQVYGEDDYRYAFALNNLAAVRASRGDHAGAFEDYQRVRDVFRASVGEDHWRNFFFTLNIETARIELGQAPEAERRLRSALGVWTPRLGDDHWLVPHAESILGGALAAQGRDEEASTLLHDAYLRLDAMGAKHRVRQQAFDRLAAFLDAQGRAGEIAALEELLGDGDPDAA